jgi:hypothetical protein
MEIIVWFAIVAVITTVCIVVGVLTYRYAKNYFELQHHNREQKRLANVNTGCAAVCPGKMTIMPNGDPCPICQFNDPTKWQRIQYVQTATMSGHQCVDVNTGIASNPSEPIQQDYTKLSCYVPYKFPSFPNKK